MTSSNYFHSFNFQGLEKVVVIGLAGAAIVTVGVVGGTAALAAGVMSGSFPALGMYSSV